MIATGLAGDVAGSVASFVEENSCHAHPRTHRWSTGCFSIRENLGRQVAEHAVTCTDHGIAKA